VGDEGSLSVLGLQPPLPDLEHTAVKGFNPFASPSVYDADYVKGTDVHIRIPADEVLHAKTRSLGREEGLFMGLPYTLFASHHIDMTKPIDMYHEDDGGIVVTQKSRHVEAMKKQVVAETHRQAHHLPAWEGVKYGGSFKIDGHHLTKQDPMTMWKNAMVSNAAAQMAATVDKQILDGIISEVVGLPKLDEPKFDDGYADALMGGFRDKKRRRR
jgi:hypothetical protein